MCPAVFGWGLCTFYTGLLETLDARKLKSELEKKNGVGGEQQQPETVVDGHKLQQSTCEIYEPD